MGLWATGRTKTEGKGLKCPHCLVAFFGDPDTHPLGEDTEGPWAIASQKCPNCKRLVLKLIRGHYVPGIPAASFADPEYESLIRPRVSARPPAPPQVSDEIAKDYLEASLISVDSPRASAALSRRCLQNVLREKAGVKHSNLFNERSLTKTSCPLTSPTRCI